MYRPPPPPLLLLQTHECQLQGQHAAAGVTQDQQAALDIVLEAKEETAFATRRDGPRTAVLLVSQPCFSGERGYYYTVIHCSRTRLQTRALALPLKMSIFAIFEGGFRGRRGGVAERRGGEGWGLYNFCGISTICACVRED